MSINELIRVASDHRQYVRLSPMARAFISVAITSAAATGNRDAADFIALLNYAPQSLTIH
jgi:hypothetical protein